MLIRSCYIIDKLSEEGWLGCISETKGVQLFILKESKSWQILGNEIKRKLHVEMGAKGINTQIYLMDEMKSLILGLKMELIGFNVRIWDDLEHEPKKFLEFLSNKSDILNTSIKQLSEKWFNKLVFEQPNPMGLELLPVIYTDLIEGYNLNTALSKISDVMGLKHVTDLMENWTTIFKYKYAHGKKSASENVKIKGGVRFKRDGVFKNVISIDFSAMYPTIICRFRLLDQLGKEIHKKYKDLYNTLKELKLNTD